jgi:hypothetical protein
MSASDHLSEIQFAIHRGLRAEKPKQPLGMHWTDDEDVAHLFAEPDPLWGDKHVVINALVAQKDIVDPDSREGKRMAAKHAIFKREHAEREVTVRPGSTVKVTSLIRKGTHKDWTQRDRVISYHPPREMKA